MPPALALKGIIEHSHNVGWLAVLQQLVSGRTYPSGALISLHGMNSSDKV